MAGKTRTRWGPLARPEMAYVDLRRGFSRNLTTECATYDLPPLKETNDEMMEEEGVKAPQEIP